ncbi:hypothetical protein D5S17_27645 [Pseudonocardiaceae bacterium YIM PH 21723]|nr:hypothetical protein D5S17_27645 [Pseudonocardiaceae bacterium YIM PH 21723]
MSTESVLVNFVYCHPVGHAVEAVQHCLGYHAADSSRRIGVVLKSNTAVDLAHWADHIDEVYTVDVDEFGEPDAAVLSHIPRDWDWVLDDPRGHQVWQHRLFPGLRRYYELAAAHFRPRHGHLQVGAPRPSYERGQRLSLRLPEEAHRWAAELLPEQDGPTIAVLPGGSAERRRYPSQASWRKILAALTERRPDTRFCLLGKLAEDGRTRTTFSKAEYEELLPDPVWAVDVPLDRQLAVLQRCDLLLAPHSGFAFTALVMGTPWLAIAGNDWAEYYFNPGVPFYSVLPDVERFPCYVLLGNTPDPVEDDGPRSPSMSAVRIEADLDELLAGAEWLLSGKATYEVAMRDHARRLAATFGGRTELMFSVDDLLREYL